MRSVRASAFFFAFFLSTAAYCETSTTDSRISEKAVENTYRFERRRDEGRFVSVGHGSAFGIDLTNYGIDSHRYMLSAAHLVLDDGRLTSGDLRVEIGKSKSSWAKCRVVAVDKVHDLCLLECDRDLGDVSSLSDGEQKVGCKVLIAGSPKGVPICLSPGTLVSKEPNVQRQVWQAEAKFNHGNSGGPVFDAETGKIIGVAVAGIRRSGDDMDENIALFTPLRLVKAFLYESAAEILLKSNRISVH
jgi:S1-C subfamily serine protease